MEVEDLKRDWQRGAGAETHAALDARTVSLWIEARAREVNRDVRSRLRREMAAYIPMLLALCVITLVQGVTATRVLFAMVLTLAVGGIVATLWRSERRLRTLAFERSVHDVLEGLLVRVEAASRAYELAYVAFFGCVMVLMAVTAWLQAGFGVWFTLAIAVGALGILWARSSGHAYVDWMFGRYRSELANCLRDLDEL
jgi:Flp pilus assembly protein TadB